jgi:hypothetical protein
LPEDVVRMLRELISVGKSAEEIAFMMRLDIDVVKAEMRRLNTTKEQPR